MLTRPRSARPALAVTLCVVATSLLGPPNLGCESCTEPEATRGDILVFVEPPAPDTVVTMCSDVTSCVELPPEPYETGVYRASIVWKRALARCRQVEMTFRVESPGCEPVEHVRPPEDRIESAQPEELRLARSCG